MASDLEELRAQLTELRERVARLETQHAASAQQTSTPDVPASQQLHLSPSRPPEAHASERINATAGPLEPGVNSASSPAQSLETRVGSHLFNRVGILALLVGIAWFLKFAFDNRWIGPTGRVLAGACLGLLLSFASERFRRTGFAAFAYSLQALGSGVLYLSLWAAFSVYALVAAPVAFAGMLVVTAANGVLSWRGDAELLAVYALAGGFATPVLLSTGTDQQTILFTYLLVLNGAALTLLTVRQWTRLLPLAFVPTAVLFFAWYLRFYSDARFASTLLFLLLFVVLFAIVPLLRLADSFAPAPLQSPLSWIVLGVLSGNAAFGAAFLYAMLRARASSRATEGAAALAFSAFYFGLMQMSRRRHGPPLWTVAGSASTLHLAFAVLFLTAAGPLGLRGQAVTIFWITESVLLVTFAARQRSLPLRVLGSGVLALALAAVAWYATEAQSVVILNARFGTFLLAALASACTSWIAKRASVAHTPSGPLSWPTLAALSIALANLLLFVAICLEIHTYWWSRSAPVTPIARGMATQISLSAWGLVFGGLLLAAGFRSRSAFLRWQALLLLAADVCKIFLLDAGRLTQGYRIVSFLALGALLLLISFVYQRDWLRLRRG